MARGRRAAVPCRGDPAGAPGGATFPFRFSPAFRLSALVFGIGPSSSGVGVGGGVFAARYGPWRVTTPLANVAGTEVTGPYRWHRAAGPARYSAADHGLTFASNGELGLCITFVDPVVGLEPAKVLHHPSLTVTVADVVGLAEALARRPDRDPGPDPH